MSERHSRGKFFGSKGYSATSAATGWSIVPRLGTQPGGPRRPLALFVSALGTTCIASTAWPSNTIAGVVRTWELMRRRAGNATVDGKY